MEQSPVDALVHLVIGCGLRRHIPIRRDLHTAVIHPAVAKRAFEAMMQMTRIDIAAIESARRG
ncbi:MAG: hypothetical protein Q7K57_21135 [Burkholderiaceae bacterium]|nr:hypothetical protein [Burkholderiaceae bacterium]